MKKKTSTYGLLVLVILIWGGIFYRLFSGSSDTPEVQKNASPKEVTKQAVSLQIPDTLLVNYPDPFLRDAFVEANGGEFDGQMENAIAQESYVEEVYVDWSGIEYVGELGNPAKKKYLVILRIQGKEYLMKIGQEEQGVKFLRNAPSAVVLSYQGQEKNLPKTATHETAQY